MSTPTATANPTSANTNGPARTTPTADELDKARELIQRAVAKGGHDALCDIRPVAISATLDPRFDPTDPRTLLEPSVEVTPVVNPLFDAVMIALGYDRLGERSYAIGAGKNTSEKIIRATLEAIPASAARSGKGAERVHQAGLDHTYYRHDSEILNELTNCPAGSKLRLEDVTRALFNIPPGSSYMMRRYNERWYAKNEDERYREHSLVGLSTNGTQLMVKVCTAWVRHRADEAELDGREHRGLAFWPGAPDLHLLRVKDVRDPIFVTPAEAVALLENARAWGFPVVDGGHIATLRQKVHDSALVERMPGAPGLARLVVGRNSLAAATAGSNLSDLAPLGSSAVYTREGTAAQISEAADQIETAGATVICDPRVRDVIVMSKAKPTGNRNPLRPYQDEAVSLHLSTDFGYVNACAPGLGKTLMALFAAKEKAEQKKGYRALVTAPAAIRSQWVGEAQRFFPKAKIASFTAREVRNDLDQLLADAGDDPVLVILSYDAMRDSADKLAEVAWDDLFCDEAAILGSTGTARTKALWKLRKVAACAVAMTGTPINRSLDDLGRLLAWARNDETAFHGQKLSKRFDMSKDEDVEALWEALGPTVFRRDRSEIADQLPKIDTEVITLDPTPAELALANGARDELRKIYETLMEKLEVARERDPDDPKLKEAQEDMKKVRGAVLGGVTLARMAASDPASIKESKSAGVALLEAARLVDPAISNGGTKRKMVVQLTDDLVSRGDAVLVFTDFASVAKDLAADLNARGVRAGTFTGENSGSKRDKAAADFQAGNLDVLILTGAGREGLNLQRASVLIHFDLPWVPSQVVQRVGRASRFGSTAEQLSVLIPIMAGTIEQRVAALLVPRAVEALRALDTHRGVDASQTEVGLSLGGLDDAVPEGIKDEQKGLFALAGELLRGDD